MSDEIGVRIPRAVSTGQDIADIAKQFVNVVYHQEDETLEYVRTGYRWGAQQGNVDADEWNHEPFSIKVRRSEYEALKHRVAELETVLAPLLRMMSKVKEIDITYGRQSKE